MPKIGPGEVIFPGRRMFIQELQRRRGKHLVDVSVPILDEDPVALLKRDAKLRKVILPGRKRYVMTTLVASRLMRTYQFGSRRENARVTVPELLKLVDVLRRIPGSKLRVWVFDQHRNTSELREVMF